MKHPEDIQTVKDEFVALYEKHFELMNVGNAAGYMDEVLASLDEDIKHGWARLNEDAPARMSDVEFDYKAAIGQIRSI